MARKTKRIYSSETLPFEENLQQFAPPYTPEKFTREEQKYLKPFFSNIHRPVFVIQHLPEEVIGALSSRYSRATKSLRRMFLDEYVAPVIYPEKQKSWIEMNEFERKEAIRTRDAFFQIIEIFNKGGGLDAVVNVQRGRKFFDTWLAQYGDDSIAEMGGIHLSVEEASKIVIKEMQDKRVGLSPLEKSSRYVQYWEKRPDGEYQYIIPGELKGTKYEAEYKEVMDMLFDTYTQIAQPYHEYIKRLYPKGHDETDKSFENSRGAKRFDDIRDLLPFALQSSSAFFGNGRAFEDVINRLMAHPVGECRWWGKAICDELEKTVPSFVRRPKTQRGAEMQRYRTNLMAVREELMNQIRTSNSTSKSARWVKLLSYTPDADIEVLSTFLLFAGNDISLTDIRKQVKKLGVRKRAAMIQEILRERKFGKKEALRQEVRFRKVPRAFENAHYLFALWARGGDYQDLQRHRQLTQERNVITTKWGYDLEKEVLQSPFLKQIEKAMHQADKLYRKLEKVNPYIAQYAVPYGYLQHWYFNMTAREIYWMIELRTGPQGRPHYREICQQIAQEATKVTPALFEGLMTDWNDYSLARRESEKKIEKKLKSLEEKKK